MLDYLSMEIKLNQRLLQHVLHLQMGKSSKPFSYKIQHLQHLSRQNISCLITQSKLLTVFIECLPNKVFEWYIDHGLVNLNIYVPNIHQTNKYFENCLIMGIICMQVP